MKKFHLVLITENLTSLEKGKKFAELVCKTLHCENDYSISKYEKLKNSFRIEINGMLAKPNHSISEAIELTDRICSPWQVTYNRTKNDITLLFNTSDFSNYRNVVFNTLRWGSFEMEDE